jgi:tetratricopeptide (TPR) repeat protein
VLAFNFASVLSYIGDEAGARKQLENLKAIDPAEHYIHAALAWVAEHKGDFEEAVAHMERAVAKNPGDAQDLSGLGFYLGRLGERDRALEVLKELERLPEGTYGKPVHLGFVYAGLEEKDQMFAHFNRALDEGSLQFRAVRYFQLDPSIRKDPRYVALFARAGLVP